jgi:hypothetical protein
MTARPGLARLPAGVPGVLLALLALAAQLLLAGVAMPEPAQAAPLAALDAFGVICHAAAPGDPQAPPARPHHGSDCALCPFCAAMAVHGAILVPAPVLPAPAMRVLAQAAPPPPARAPPARRVRAALARAPPVLA